MTWHPILMFPIALAVILLAFVILYVIDVCTRDPKKEPEMDAVRNLREFIDYQQREINRLCLGTPYPKHWKDGDPISVTNCFGYGKSVMEEIWPIWYAKNQLNIMPMIYWPKDSRPKPTLVPDDDKIEPDDADNQLGWKR